MSLVCSSIATHRTCQLRARSEPVNMPKTIESPAKCRVHAVIRFLYSEKATRNVVLRFFFIKVFDRALQLHQRGSWSVFDGTVFDHQPLSTRTWLPVIFIFFLVRNGHKRTTFWHNELQTRVENWLKAQTTGFYDEGIGKLVPRYEKYLRRSVDYVEK